MAETPSLEYHLRHHFGCVFIDGQDCDCGRDAAAAELARIKRRMDELEQANADLRRRNRVLDIVQAHDRWAREGQEGALLTLRNTLETFRAEMG